MIYLAVLIIGLALSISNGKSKSYFYSYLFLLLILASFRYGVGPDYFGYQYLYTLVNTSITEQVGQVTGQELIFRLFGSFLNTVDFSYQQYLALTALITLYYLGRLCKKYSAYPMVSLYLYYCLFYFVWVFSGIRQGLALAIGSYYLLECLESRNHFKFVIIAFLLSLIHASSLILLLFYGLANLNISRKTLLIGVFFCFCVSLIPPSYLLAGFSHLPYSERIEFYVGGDADALAISYFDFKSISRFILLLLIGVLFARSYNEKDEIQQKVMSIYIASFGVYYALRFVEILAANASVYGFMLIVLILPNMYDKLKNGPNSRAFLVFISIFSIAYFFKTLSGMEEMSELSHPYLITPYTNIFNQSDYYFPFAP